ncbi:SMI1/KNR4 family protein [Catellatospora sp. NPDC049609]|uniref:SMI1/KNR4 family protein n=1 Tax=Catellatospora sp. NPDC049609 TaxID=3155505 RepID=UPI0034329EC5
MAVTYKREAPPAPESDVARLEHRIRRSLPADYRAYLLNQDGGRPITNDKAVKEIFGIREDAPDWANMWDKLDIFHGRYPAWLLPVAQDEYGNLFALSLREQDFGSVWFWDHEEEADEGEPPSEDNIEKWADSWTEFLASLQPAG